MAYTTQLNSPMIVCNELLDAGHEKGGEKRSVISEGTTLIASA
jgi:hypothetical protein